MVRTCSAPCNGVPTSFMRTLGGIRCTFNWRNTSPAGSWGVQCSSGTAWNVCSPRWLFSFCCGLSLPICPPFTFGVAFPSGYAWFIPPTNQYRMSMLRGRIPIRNVRMNHYASIFACMKQKKQLNWPPHVGLGIWCMVYPLGSAPCKLLPFPPWCTWWMQRRGWLSICMRVWRSAWRGETRGHIPLGWPPQYWRG